LGKKADTVLTGDDIREGLTVVVSVKIPQPQFEGQTKTKLGSDVSGLVQSIVSGKLADFFAENPAVKFSSFLDGLNHFLKAVGAILWQTLWIFLWTFCFIIPAFIKAYSYSQIMYLLAEYPNMKINHAMKLSMKITKGYKWDLFFMELSFLGWMILTALTLGLLSFYVTPYYELTRVNAYKFLKAKALETGTITEEDLNRDF
jgi:uncharacterized membrane protein